PALPAVWARGKLRELEDRYLVGGSDRTRLEKDIVALSLRFGVLCRFTSFVAVDRAEVVNRGGEQHRVTQAVEIPAGWAEARAASTLCGAMPMACPAPMPMKSMSPKTLGAMPPSAPDEEEEVPTSTFAP